MAKAKLITRMRHRLGKWLWAENEWTHAVDEIERAAKDIRSSRVLEVYLHWQFKFMEPPNKFTIIVKPRKD